MRSFTMLVLASTVLGGCARVPQESVELSATVGRDLAEAHRANRELAVRYFDRMRQDVERFVTSTYRPYIIHQTMAELKLLDDIQRATAPGSDLDPLDIMEIYVEETLAQVATFRQSMLDPINARERQVLSAIDETYQRLQNANSIVTGHLASVRKVNDVQAQLLRDVGAGNIAEKLSGQIVEFSGTLDQVLEQGRKAERLLDQGMGALPQVKAAMDSLPQILRRLAGQSGDH